MRVIFGCVICFLRISDLEHIPANNFLTRSEYRNLRLLSIRSLKTNIDGNTK